MAIPGWYCLGMGQMTVRLSDESTEYIDTLVAEGRAPSRAAALDRMVKRQRRRAEAEKDALIYASLSEAERVEDQQRGSWGSENAAKVWADLD